MTIRWGLFWIALLVFAEITPLIGQELNEIVMTPGETRTFEFPKDADLRVSKRGIVEIQWLEGMSWRVTALRTGVALIKVLSPAAQELVRTVIKVEPAAEESKASQTMHDAFAGICQAERIRCNSETNSMQGESDLWAWYLKAYGLCHRTAECSFGIVLSTKGLELFAQDLAELLDTKVKTSRLSSGKLMVTMPCALKTQLEAEKMIDSLTDGAHSKNYLTINCTRILVDQAYKLTAKIFFLRDSDAKDLGLDWQTVAESHRPTLRAFLEKNQSRILSDPVLDIRLDQDIEIRSGAEIQIESRSTDPIEHWRPTGLVMTARCGYLWSDKFSFRYTLKLTTEAKSEAGNLNAGSLASEATLVLGEGKILGEINSIFNKDTENGVPILRDIPIIAPLFRLESKSEDHSKVYLWVQLDKV